MAKQDSGTKGSFSPRAQTWSHPACRSCTASAALVSAFPLRQTAAGWPRCQGMPRWLKTWSLHAGGTPPPRVTVGIFTNDPKQVVMKRWRYFQDVQFKNEINLFQNCQTLKETLKAFKSVFQLGRKILRVDGSVIREAREPQKGKHPLHLGCRGSSEGPQGTWDRMADAPVALSLVIFPEVSVWFLEGWEQHSQLLWGEGADWRGRPL